MNSAQAVALLSSIAQEARLDIFRLLVQAGKEGVSAGVIGEQLNIPASTLSFHLKELNHAGMVQAKQVSRYVYYSANYTVMNGLIGYLTENCCANAPVSNCLPALPCNTCE